MAFGQPGQQQHMIQGKLKAARSAKTPRHLREHLIKQANATKRPPMGATGAKKGTNGGANAFAPAVPLNGPKATDTPMSPGYKRPGGGGNPAGPRGRLGMAKNISPIYG